jgi:NADPH2:quinone reductase
MGNSLPSTMKAIQLDKPNGTLTVQEVPVPRPKKGLVLIQMAASPINPTDLNSLTGAKLYGERNYPFTPGVEGSGTVVAAGEGVLPRFLLGKRVACVAPVPRNGTWAEYMLTSATRCVPLKKNVSLEQGAMLMVNPLSALAIFDIAKSGGHQAIVSTAAASALGGMILRLGKRFGIPIINTVRREAQMDLVRQRGGEFILNSRDPDFVQQLSETTHRLKATLFLDAVGGNLTQKLADAAPYKSTILLYANLSRKDCDIKTQTALHKHLKLEGFYLSNWSRENGFVKSIRQAYRAQSLVETDLYSPIAQYLPLEETPQAIQMYMSDMTAGKILLVANSEIGR